MTAAGAKTQRLHLHIGPCGLELPGSNHYVSSSISEEQVVMKKLILLTTVAHVVMGLAGCNTCRQMTSGWFNRGDRCNACPPPACAPGMPQATMLVPSSPQVLPGPIEIAPTN
jgi:hypothetical protein